MNNNSTEVDLENIVINTDEFSFKERKKFLE
jgi:hypothetical protein